MATTTIRYTMVMGLALAGLQASAQGVRIEALERAFWRCDYAATQGLLDGAAAMDCSVVFEALKAHRFGGDFRAMLAWWRERKDDEHLSLAAVQAKQVAARRP